MHPETLYAHLLVNQPGLGAVGLQSLHKQFGSFANILSASPEQLPPRSRKPVTAIQQQLKSLQTDAQQALNALQQSGVTLLCLSDDTYPTLLREIPSPPPLLYVRGNVDALSLPAIAIVGSRNASRGGIEHAARFAATLAAGGFAITSGLALGIDGAAHRGALAKGITIAVIGTGIDRVYPRGHRDLSAEIIANHGAIVSEFPPGTPPLASNFPRRNRIISGLSTGVLVVEAALKSGSLITARLAMEQGREVFAIPGSVNNPLAKGCHRLIREGATLTETTDDIIQQLGGMLSFKQAEVAAETRDASTALGTGASHLLAAMGYDPVGIDALAGHLNLDITILSGLLVELEIQGLVENQGGLYVRTA